MRTLYGIVRDLTGAQGTTNVPVRCKDGKVLLTEREQSAPWVEHFNEVLSQPVPDELFSFDSEGQFKLAATLRGSRPGVQSASPKNPKNTSF